MMRPYRVSPCWTSRPSTLRRGGWTGYRPLQPPSASPGWLPTPRIKPQAGVGHSMALMILLWCLLASVLVHRPTTRPSTTPSQQSTKSKNP